MSKEVIIIPAKNDTKDSAKRKVLRVAAYCRVSTEHEEQMQSFQNQVEYYTDLIRSKSGWEMAGIFADEGISGTGTRKREGFRKMIRFCQKGEIDLVITKSVSRFARNTTDFLHYIRLLKELGIPVIFENEGIHSMESSGELIFTILSSLAQEESRNISENTRWGIRSRFQKGIPHLNTVRFMGYDKDENGKLAINPAQAEVVREIFDKFLYGWSPGEIAADLRRRNVPGVTGKASWSLNTILRMLRNEKYKGDLLMQKHYTVSFLTKKQARNHGQLEQYLITGNHEPIISSGEWDAVQEELARRKAFREEHNLKKTGSPTGNPFFNKVFCEKCGGVFVRRYCPRYREPLWKCHNAEKSRGKICSDSSIAESTLEKAMGSVWTKQIHCRNDLRSDTFRKVDDRSALDLYRTEQMAHLIEGGADVWTFAKAMLEKVVVEADGGLRIGLLNGDILPHRVIAPEN